MIDRGIPSLALTIIVSEPIKFVRILISSTPRDPEA